MPQFRVNIPIYHALPVTSQAGLGRDSCTQGPGRIQKERSYVASKWRRKKNRNILNMFKAYHEDSGTNTFNDYRSLTSNNSHASLTINWYFAWLIVIDNEYNHSFLYIHKEKLNNGIITVGSDP